MTRNQPEMRRRTPSLGNHVSPTTPDTKELVFRVGAGRGDEPMGRRIVKGYVRFSGDF